MTLRTRSANIGGALITATSITLSTGTDLSTQANDAYGQANTAYAQANDAYTAANTANVNALAAYGQANDAYSQANTARSDANTTFNTINTTFSTVNTAITNAHNQANNAYAEANLKLNIAGGTITGSLNVAGNLIITGNTTTVNTESLVVNDPIILLANNNTTDIVDIGFIGHYGSTQKHAGLVRHYSDNKFYLFTNYDEHVLSHNNIIDIANVELATLKSNIEANTLTVLNGVSGNVNFDSGTLFVDSVANNVGIGTDSPSYRLSVKQSGNTSYASLGIVSTNSADDTAIGIGYDATSDTNRVISSYVSTGAYKPISFWTSDTERMRIDSSGNVGIGTSSPASKLSVGGNPPTSGIVAGVSAADGISLALSDNINNSFYVKHVSGGAATIGTDSGGQLAFATNGFSERMRITSAGNVGIGTNNPGYTLVVGGNANSSIVSQVYNANTGASALAITQLNCGGRYVNQQVNYLNQYYQESQDGITTKYTDFNTQIFRNGAGTEAMRITNGGDVGIGTASPARKLTVHTTSEWPILLRGASDTTTNRMSAILMQRARGSLASPTVPTSGTNLGGIEIGGYNTSTYTEGYNGGAAIFAFADGTWTSTSNPTYLSFYTNASGAAGATERVRISAAGGFSVGTSADPGAGAIFATGNITAYYSDARLKEFRGRIKNALDKVSKLNGYYYVENEVAAQYGYTNKEEQVGVSAQEVEAVLPHVVAKAPFDLAQDENGIEYSKSGEDYKTVRYERLIPLLIEAIKEQQEQIDELKNIIKRGSN